MANSLDRLSARAALVEIARDFHARGWMHGTAGNLSAREDAEHFWVTASGQPKGRLDESDFLLVRAADGAVIESARAGNKPSAETAIHRAIYALAPEARACLHGHSVDACLVSARARPKARALRLPQIEMVKGLDIWEQKPKADLPLFENTLDVARIAEEIGRRFRKAPPAVSALLVRAHGATVWGRGLQEAYNRFEVLEFILGYMARTR
ncbi:MAG: methylthioribulose-1-phosphate dehydratase [Candidatus Muproteobacteria bacterium RBG_16_65_34]|uniref:Methylthioribulose-1-phosphate dehydratase n=1 Tax=Candidatus Muproteobacteria bacterium RBG_16_65_34 TaxID=1817760 RepID=A0A1F6TNF7_9PROT|nr:MAG: methylthioribulose-1-phosphate dehydratase [Candidatus Muproteobacteria bacterium RBG_16_65_34]